MIKVFKTPLLIRWFYHRRVWGFSNSKHVYLTFDDGPTVAMTRWILATLKDKGVKATFFCVGQNVKDNPEFLEAIIEDGHAVGNHTMHHEKGSDVESTAYLESISEASKYINSNLFRPPYGRLSIWKSKKIRKKYKIIMWSWLSYDYDHDVPVEDILNSAERQIVGGDVLVLHDNIKVEERLKIILPAIIDIVHKKGLSFEVIAS